MRATALFAAATFGTALTVATGAGAAVIIDGDNVAPDPDAKTISDALNALRIDVDSNGNSLADQGITFRAAGTLDSTSGVEPVSSFSAFESNAGEGRGRVLGYVEPGLGISRRFFGNENTPANDSHEYLILGLAPEAEASLVSVSVRSVQLLPTYLIQAFDATGILLDTQSAPLVGSDPVTVSVSSPLPNIARVLFGTVNNFSGVVAFDTISITAIPEPLSLATAACGLLAVVGVRRRA